MNTKLFSFAFVGLLGLNLTNTSPTSVGPRDLRIGTETDMHISTSTGSPRPGIGTRIEDGLRNFLKVGSGSESGTRNLRGTLSGTVTAVGSSSITVSSNGGSVQVDVTPTTRYARKFWGDSSLSEISVGDTVQVVGKWTSDAKTEITAVLVRDTSIQKRNGVFFGKVTSLTSGGFVFDTIHRDSETVTFGTAKIVDRKGGTLGQSDIKVGDYVRVRGMWDSTAKTITETVEVKDFSLPPFSSPSASPAPTP